MWRDQYGTTCDDCRAMYAERNPPATPPCESCRVDLVSDNEEAAQILMVVRGQVLTRWNGERDIPVDLNHVAVWAAIDGLGVEDRAGTFGKVCRAWHAVERAGDAG